MKRGINVAKFGGTSMANYSTMQKCAKIVTSNPKTKVVVVSASAGVTNFLVELGSHVIEERRSEVLQSIQDISLSIWNGLGQPEQVMQQLDLLFKELQEVANLEDLSTSLQTRDQLLALGERMSSTLFSEVIRQMNHNAVTFDARKVMRTDSRFGIATPQIEAIEKLVTSIMLPASETSILVTQGFIGSDELGRTTTLGRGGSDYTASLLAEALNAETCEIWTDVPGVYTTDPRITEQAKVLHELSFDEAAEMATFGAKVLHPDTMIPALRQDIRVFVGSSFAPEKGGTWIMRDCVEEPPFRSITRRSDQVMATFKVSKGLASTALMTRIFSIFQEYDVEVDLITMSETTVSISLDNKALSPWNTHQAAVLSKLKEFCEVNIEPGFNLITIVGNNLHNFPGTSGQIFTAINDYPVRMICYGANPHNISFLVPTDQSTEIIRQLHSELIG